MATRPTNTDDAAPRDELGELDTLVSSLVAEMNEAADEITRVMRSDDDAEAAAADAVAKGQALTDEGAIEHDSDEPIDAEASADQDEPDAPDMSAESIDAALADVASQLQADLDASGPAQEELPEVDRADDAAAPLDETPEPAASDETDPGAESIAAQIDEELARAFREEVGEPGVVEAPAPEQEAPEPEAAEPETTEPEASETEATEAEVADGAASDNAEPEDAADAAPVNEPEVDATEDAVNAVAETIDRLLDAPDDESSPRAVAVTDEEAEEHAAQPADAFAQPSEDNDDTEPDASSPDADADADEDEDASEEPEAVAPPAPAAPAVPPEPKAAPVAPAPKKAPAPKAPPPKPEEAPAPRKFPIPMRLPGGVGALATAALVVVNKPLLKLPRQLRDTLGLAGLVTLFNAACLWVFLMLR